MNVLGIDIGGTGIKAAIVNTKTGELITERHRISTPKPATPEAVASVVKQMGLDTSKEKFTPKLQDEIAIFHLRANHGLDKWLSGSMSNEQFLNRLAGTWAGIPQTNGRSRYAGVLDNKAGMGAQAALDGLDSIRGLA